MRNILGYFSEVRSELRKVTWPKKEEVIKLTLIVFIISVIVGGYVGGLDYLLTKALELTVVK